MSSSSNSDSGMDDDQIEEERGWIPLACFRPFTRQNVLHYYVPCGGSVCYTALSVHFVKQSFFRRMMPEFDPANLLLTGSLAGSCFYIYDRKHLKNCEGMKKVGYSVFAAGMFNLGSLIIWAMIRGATPDKDLTGQVVRVVLAIGSSVLLLRTGIGYLREIDAQVKGVQ